MEAPAITVETPDRPRRRPGRRRPRLLYGATGLALCLAVCLVVAGPGADTTRSALTLLTGGTGTVSDEPTVTSLDPGASVPPTGAPDAGTTPATPTTVASTATTTGSVPAPSAASPTTTSRPTRTAAPAAPGPASPPLPPAIALPTPDPAVTLFPVPTAASQPMGVAAGPDGNVWFTESTSDVVGRVTPGGTVTEFHTPTPHSQPMGIVVGADRNLWFAELSGNNIGRITTAGTITEFPIPTANSQPWGRMALGADGAVWFTERNANRIGRVTTAGQVSEFALDPASGPAAALPAGIVSAGDGNLWFLETNVGKLGRITPAGVVTTFDTGGSMPMAIGVDAAGRVWAGELNTSTGDSRIVRVDSAGHSTVVASGTRYANFVDLATGPDGAMWFTAGNTNEIGRIRPDGSVSELSAPSPGFLADGPGGALWFASGTGNAIGRVTVG